MRTLKDQFFKQQEVFMSPDRSRREFLQAGLALPAAGLVSSSLGPTFQKEPPKITYRTLGKTGLKVTGVGYGIGYVPNVEVVNRAIDLGINYFDTSRDYKESEAIFAGCIKNGRRQKIHISSKSGSTKKDEILKDMDTSLKTLGTDYVDIWHLHARDTPARIPDDALEAMAQCKKSGKARYIGFSCHNPNNMVDFHLNSKVFDVMQTTYSYAIGSGFREKAVQKLAAANIGVIAMKVVVALSGIGMGRGGSGTQSKKKEGEGPLAGIKWVLSNPAIGVTVPNMNSIEELEMNMRALSEPYTPADEQLLFTLNERIRPDYCRMCYQCDGNCPKGMPVAEVLRFLAYYDFAGSLYQATMNFRNLDPEIRNIRCSDCSECVIKCPNGVQVRNRLMRAQELLA
jgi:predicted aldo/keto reductase-like oxidoreductase